MDHKKLAELEVNESFTGFYALRNVEIKEKKDGAPFLKLEIGDSSGRLPVVYWEDDSAAVFEEISGSEVVKIQGTGGLYRDLMQAVATQIRSAQEGEFDLANLLPSGEKSTEELSAELDVWIDSVSEPPLSKLLKSIFDDDETRAKFLRAPAGKLWHGAYVGGLAEHSLNVAEICETAAKLFPLCRRDLVITAALLHDIGKIRELEASAAIDYTARGRLLGHIVLGDRIIERAAAKLSIPRKLADELSHILLAHHGAGEFGSPVEPMNIEAELLHQADLMESRGNAFTHVIERDLPNAGEFSRWVKPVSRYLYIEGYRPEKPAQESLFPTEPGESPE